MSFNDYKALTEEKIILLNELIMLPEEKIVVEDHRS
jgi:hypothetical protein